MLDIQISAIGILAAATLFGVWLNRRFSFLKRFFIPRALPAGVLLLLLGPEVAEILPAENYSAWKKWPGFLISFLFAGLILSETAPSRRQETTTSRPFKEFLPVIQQSIYVWYLAVGQLALGFICAVFVALPLGKSTLIAHIIEIGWVGGHGAATAMSGIMAELARTAREAGQPVAAQQFAEIGDLAIFSATAGLMLGGGAGVLMVNVLRRFYSDELKNNEADVLPEPNSEEANSEIASGANTPAVSGEERAEFLLTALGALAFSVFLAALFKDALVLFANGVIGKATGDFIAEFPLFSIALLFALLVRFLGRRAGLLPPGLVEEIRKLTAITLEILIISALATLRLTAFTQNLTIFLVMMGSALLFCIFSLLVIAPRLLPEKQWMELGLLNFGMSTGVTALGLLFAGSLRGRLNPGVARVYALAAPFSAPLIGGGIISFLLPDMTRRGFHLELLFALCAATLLIFLLGFALKKINEK